MIGRVSQTGKKGLATVLSIDELSNGMTFILKLRDAAGAEVQWAETLRGDIAKRWYDIYQRSDWAALRMEATDVFRNCVSEEEAESIRKSGRCVVIKTQAVQVSDLLAARCGKDADYVTAASARREQ